MCFEDLLVILNCCLFYVERSKASRSLYQVVVEPLVPASGEECVSKVISVMRAAGSAEAIMKGGRSTPKKRQQKREFDPTRGYPGEDINL